MQYGKGRIRKVATINLCERCGTMATSPAMAVIGSAARAAYGVDGFQEICPGCYEDLTHFMKGEQVYPLSAVERPRSYSEPWQPTKTDSPLADLSDDAVMREYHRRMANKPVEITDGNDD